ncbi:MAG: transcriptional regulator with XRE-family HTH domain [Gammaproteobacteria bacterium]|jgi:transcriptional regulator with XRE-family HTH domain
MSTTDESADLTNQVLQDRVTLLRKKNKLTLNQLASLSGVSRSMLSQIERGQANPTLAVTFRIAQAFGISIGELVEQVGSSANIDIVHADDPNNLFRTDKECKIRTLSPLHTEKSVEFYELKIAAKSSLQSAAHFEGARELLTVTKGTASIESGTTHCVLGVGDTAHYRADVEHCIENTGTDELVCFLVVTYQ